MKWNDGSAVHFSRLYASHQPNLKHSYTTYNGWSRYKLPVYKDISKNDSSRTNNSEWCVAAFLKDTSTQGDWTPSVWQLADCHKAMVTYVTICQLGDSRWGVVNRPRYVLYIDRMRLDFFLIHKSMAEKGQGVYFGDYYCLGFIGVSYPRHWSYNNKDDDDVEDMVTFVQKHLRKLNQVCFEKPFPTVSIVRIGPYVGFYENKDFILLNSSQITTKLFCPNSVLALDGKCIKISIVQPNRSLVRTIIEAHQEPIHLWLFKSLERFTVSSILINTTTHITDHTRYAGHIGLHAAVISSMPHVQHEACLSELQFTCKDGHCIWDGLLLDAHRDCPDGSDEQADYIHRRLSHINITQYAYFLCSDTKKIFWQQICDSKFDCVDLSDELLCNKTVMRLLDHRQVISQNEPELFHCTKSNKYIPISWLYDPFPDCPYLDATVSKIGIEDTAPMSNVTRYHCSAEDSLPCVAAYPVCFPASQLCQFDIDTSGRLKYCREGFHLIACSQFQCPITFKCAGAYCLPLFRVCDGIHDCPFGDDEKECPANEDSLLCPGLFKCRSGKCLHHVHVCDGNPDCGDAAEDEQVCTPPGCHDRCRCYWQSMVCAGSIDKIDGYSFKHIQVSKTDVVPVIFNGSRVIYYNASHGFITKLKPNQFRAVGHVAVIDMSHNQLYLIMSGAFQALFHLQLLFLHGNWIQTLEDLAFHSLPRLLELDLSGLNISDITEAVFTNLTYITAINISNNKIRMIEIDFIYSLPHLRELDIRQNPIVLVRTRQKQLDANVYVVTDNPLICCYVTCQSNNTKKVDCMEEFGAIPNTLMVSVGLTVIFLNGFASWVRMKLPFLVGGALVQIHVAGILAGISLLLYQLQTPFTVDGYVDLSYICLTCVSCQCVALLAVPAFSALQMFTMYKRMHRIIASVTNSKLRLGISITWILVLLLSSVSIGLKLSAEEDITKNSFKFCSVFQSTLLREELRSSSPLLTILVFKLITFCISTISYVLTCVVLARSEAAVAGMDSSKVTKDTLLTPHTRVYLGVSTSISICYTPVICLASYCLMGNIIPQVGQYCAHVVVVPIVATVAAPAPLYMALKKRFKDNSATA